MLLGEVLNKIQKKSYFKLFIGVETGYNIDFYTIRVRNYHTIKDLDVGDQVLFSGHYITKRNIRQFKLDFIRKQTFIQCVVCHIPLTSNACFIKHDKEAQKICGEWRVVHKIQRDGCIKVFFEKKNFVFAAVATSKCWFYPLFKKLKDNVEVVIRGWRYKQKTCIKTIYMKKTCEMMDTHYENVYMNKTFEKDENVYEIMKNPNANIQPLQ